MKRSNEVQQGPKGELWKKREAATKAGAMKGGPTAKTASKTAKAITTAATPKEAAVTRDGGEGNAPTSCPIIKEE